jgi:hypothetical protein
MIGFDNGPEDGDFVRYIDALLATRAAAPSQSVREFDPRSVIAPVGVPSFAQPPIAVPGAPSRAVAGAANRNPPMPRPQRASRVPGTTLTPGQVASAAATMIRDAGAVNAQVRVSLVALLLGVALLVAGWIGPSFSAPFVFAGAALAYWAIRRLAGSTRAPPDRRP